MNENIAFYRPKNIAETLSFLNNNQAAIISGGTDLMVDIRSGNFTADYLVDVSQLEELKKIEEKDNSIYIGAGVKIEELKNSELINKKLPLLAQVAENFAGLQIRNQATIGGNVGHASPCGDTHPPLIVYNAKALVSTTSGQEKIAVEKLFAGPNKSALKSNQLIEGFLLTPHKVKFGKFEKIGRRKDLAISRVTLAVLINYNTDDIIDFCHISLGACLPSTARMPKTEDFLMGQKININLFQKAAKLMSEEMISVTGRRPSVIYKEPAIEGLTLRVLSSLLVNK